MQTGSFFRVARPALGIVLCLGLLTGCQAAMKRGISDDQTAYVSSTRPALRVSVHDIPLVTSGFGTGRLYDANQLGGLRIDAWAFYFAKSPKGPAVAIVQAELPDAWLWTTVYPPSSACDVRQEYLAGKAYTAYTHLIAVQRDAFAGLAGETVPEEQPVYWLVRTFEGIYHETQSKMILQYREALSEDMLAQLTPNLLLDMDRTELSAFRERALAAISVERGNFRDGVENSRAGSVRWQYVSDALLGPVMERNIGE